MVKGKNTLRWNMFAFDRMKKASNFLHQEIKNIEGLTERSKAVFDFYQQLISIQTGFNYKTKSKITNERRALPDENLTDQARRLAYTIVLKEQYFKWELVLKLAQLTNSDEFVNSAKEHYDKWFETDFEGDGI